MMRVDLPSSVKCYDVCPNSSPSDITWCVHVYHPKENISLCLNNGGIINETYAASVLALEKEFVVKQVGGHEYEFGIQNRSMWPCSIGCIMCMHCFLCSSCP